MTHDIFDHDNDGATFIGYLTALVNIRLIWLQAETEIAWTGDWEQATRDAMHDAAWHRKLHGHANFERWADTSSFVERYGACPVCSEPLAWHHNAQPQADCFAPHPYPCG